MSSSNVPPSPSPLSAEAVDVERRELADAMPHIVWTSDESGAPTYFNRKWSEYTGLDLDATLKLGSAMVVHPEDREEVTGRLAEARHRGESLELVYRLRGRDGLCRWHEARIVPLRRSGDRVVAWVGTAVDIDEARRVGDEQRFLIEATNVLGTSLDVSKTLHDVARLVVPHLADWCAIDILGDDGLIHRPAVAHVDPKKVSLAWDLWRRVPPRPTDPTGVYAVMKTRRPEHFADIPDEALVASIPDPEILALVRSLGLRSSMCVPLVARNRVLGALSLVSAESGRSYTTRDLSFADDFARRIALAVDNARLYTEANSARAVAEAMAQEVLDQSRRVEEALITMRAERDAALASRGGG